MRHSYAWWTSMFLLVAAWPARAAIDLDLSYVDTSGPAYVRFKGFVDQAVAGNPGYAFSATDAVYVYRLQGGAQYANLAIQMVEEQVVAAEAAIAAGQRPEIAGDSYLHIGPMLRDLALVYDWCYPLLTQTQRVRWAEYAEQAVWNVWNPTQAHWGAVDGTWSGWSIDDPGNNYYYSFLEATMYWSLASNGTTWRTFLETQKIPPLIAFFQTLPGGGSREGTAYGLSHQRLFELYRLWRDATGVNLATQSSHLQDSLDYWIHATMPTLDTLAPIGDQARVSYPEMYDYHRNLVLQARAMATDPGARARASWWLDAIAIDRMTSGFNFRHDLLPAGTSGTVPTARTYHATGAGHLFSRTSWDPDALWLGFVAGRYDQSHAHQDQGAFTLFAREFLAVTENIWTHSGIQQGGDVHNVVRFRNGGNDVRQVEGTTSTVTTSTASDGALVVAADLTPAYNGNPQLVSWQRDLRFAGRTLRVHDVFVPGPGTTAVWQVNVPVAPQISGRNGRAGDLSIRVLTPSDAVLTAVDWRTFGASEFRSGWKIEVRGSGTEFLVELGDDRSLFSDGFE